MSKFIIYQIYIKQILLTYRRSLKTYFLIEGFCVLFLILLYIQKENSITMSYIITLGAVVYLVEYPWKYVTVVLFQRYSKMYLRNCNMKCLLWLQMLIYIFHFYCCFVKKICVSSDIMVILDCTSKVSGTDFLKSNIIYNIRYLWKFNIQSSPWCSAQLDTILFMAFLLRIPNRRPCGLL